MTLKEIKSNYGDIKLRFHYYYKYKFQFSAIAPDGKLIVMIIGDGHPDDIYRTEITKETIKTLNKSEYDGVQIFNGGSLVASIEL